MFNKALIKQITIVELKYNEISTKINNSWI